MIRKNGGYADSEGGVDCASWSILMRVFCGRTPDSPVLATCEDCGHTVTDGVDACYELARVLCEPCFLGRFDT